jgi:hypothetical protein
MNKSKILLFFLLLILSILVSLVTTYFYCGWQHGRYWNGTIKKVNLIESAVYEKLLYQNIANQYPKADYSVFSEIFAPLNGKLLIRFRDNSDQIIFSNLSQDRSPIELLRKSDFLIGSDKFTVEFVRYAPPNWTDVYFSWLVSPSDWLKSVHDRITMPFFFFLAIWFLFFVASLWRYRARHLSRDVMGALNSLNKSQ